MSIEMTPREQRGLQIAAVCKIRKNKNGEWLVPSQSGNGKYEVCADPAHLHCTCPDHANNGGKCKHIFAVEFVMRREQHDDGSETLTNGVVIRERKTYRQDWAAYNAAQTNEKAKFQSLLYDLCRRIAEPPPKNGRPRLLLADAMFSAVFKVYSTFSGRRFMTDLEEAYAKGFIKKVPHFNSIFNYLENPEVARILTAMIVEGSRPLAAVEIDFASDSSGCSTCRFERWFDKKYGVVRKQHDWVKFHIMCGVKTNIVTAVEIRDRNASDTKLLPALAKTTAKNFTMREVSADKGYASLDNYAVIDSLGATPFIAFKSIHTGAGGGLWAKMFHYFNYRRDDFLKHYHKRSNVESVFSAIKAKFGDSVRSKGEMAMVNEVLCKVLCHNICCLIQEMYELGIEPEFWEEKGEGKKVG